MVKKWSMVLSMLALVSFLTPALCVAQYNPSGWIVVDGWNHALQYLNPFGAAPSPDVMKMNWVTPHVIGEEDPDGSTGERWRDVDFEASPSTGWDNGGITPDPIWFTTGVLYSNFSQIPADSLSGGDPGLINIQDDFVNVLNANLGEGAPDPLPGFTPIPGDNVMSMATTYVDNTTGAALLIDVCTASDDSIQAWINNKCVANVSAARGSSGDCQETNPAVLPPGVSKIATLVWEGGGGHNFRLAIELDGVKLADGNGMVEFLGPEGETQTQYCVNRTAVGNDPETGCNTSARVTISGDGDGAGDGMVTVSDQVDGDPEVVEITEVSNEGTVEDVGVSDDGIDLTTGAALEFHVLGPILNPGGAAPGEEAIRAEYLIIADGEVGTLNVDDMVDDIDGTPQTVRRLAVNNGDALEFDQVGGAGDNIMHYAWTKLTLSEPTNVAIGVNADDSVQVLLIRDGEDEAEEVTIHNGGQGFGGVGSMEWSGLASLPAGTHTVLTKTYEGGGGHGVRLLFYRVPSMGIGAGGLDCDNATSIAPGETGVGATSGGEIGFDCDPQTSRASYFAVEGTGARMRAETCNPVFFYDTYIAVFAGACDAAGCVASNDDTCGRQSVVEWDSSEGETYYVRVYGWAARQGVYFVRVSDTDTPAANAIVAVPLQGDDVCADPDGDCDPAARTVLARRVTWTVTRGTLDDTGVGYTLSGTSASFSNGTVSDDNGPIAITGGDSSTPTIISEGEACPPIKLAGLQGNDLTDVGDDGDPALYNAPDDLGGFDAEFFSSDEPAFGAGEAAFNVFDNVVGGGKWCCGTTFPQIVGADFTNTSGEEVPLTSFTVSSANDTPGRDPRVWRMEGSNDGETWVTIFEQDDPSTSLWGDTRNCTLLFLEGVHYPVQEDAYIMFRMVTEQTGLDTGAFFQLAEIELFSEPAPPGVGPFVRGDSDGSGTVDLTDGIVIFNWLFLGGPEPQCQAAANTNQSENIDITSGIFLLNWLFLGGPMPPPPNAATGCGNSDAPEDVALGCEMPTC